MSATPTLFSDGSKHRFKGMAMVLVAGFQPQLLKTVGNNHGHPVVQRFHQGIGLGGDDAAGFDFAAIRPHPAIPEPRQPKHGLVVPTDLMAFFKKAAAR